ncbi:hypothetical protein HY251_07000, partial [bacterium]|nr:hypothetical protein [bacterium]
TAAAAKRRAREVSSVSHERIREEIDKMLSDPNRARAAALLSELDLAPVVFQEVDAPSFALGRSVLAELPREVPRALAWAALLAGVDARTADALLVRLRSSNADREAICALVRDRKRARSIGELRLADRKRLLLRGDAPALLELARAEAVATKQDLSGLALSHAKRQEFQEETGPHALASPPLVRGNDLKDMGLPPGPHFREILDYAENARLEGRAKDKESLLAAIRAEHPEWFEKKS